MSLRRFWKMNDSLEKIFAEYRPQMGDSKKYMAEIEKKLEVAEYFKKERRHLKLAAVVACIAGSVVGGIVVTFFFTHPIGLPDFNFIKWFSGNIWTTITVALGCSALGYITAYYLDKDLL